MRCLHCLRRGHHAPWCPAWGVPVPVSDPEIPVATRSARRGTTGYTVALVFVLTGLCLVGMGVLNEWTGGGVETIVREQLENAQVSTGR